MKTKLIEASDKILKAARGGAAMYIQKIKISVTTGFLLEIMWGDSGGTSLNQ